jgi:hypothetical protein
VNSYDIDIKGGRLVFSTASFSTGDMSMLHSGIYNREMSSSLAAGAVTLAVVVATIYSDLRLGHFHFALAAAVFAGSFFLFRMFVFYEAGLRLVIDMNRDTIEVRRKGLARRKRTFPLGKLADICGGLTIISPKNPDGIDMVRKISLQHGQVIPGLGEVRKYHTVSLEMKDATGITVFSSEDPSSAKSALKDLKDFLGNRDA